MQAEKKLGKVVVAPEVLITMVENTTLSTPGVARLNANWPENIGKKLGIVSASEGISVQVVNDALVIDVHLIAFADAQMLELGRTLQAAIRRSIHELAGLDVKAVNIHIEDVESDFEKKVA